MTDWRGEDLELRLRRPVQAKAGDAAALLDGLPGCFQKARGRGYPDS